MEAYAEPLRALSERGRFFVRSREIRIFYAVVAPDFREPAAEILHKLEFHSDNSSPFLRFDTPHTSAAPGWALRTQHAREQHAERALAMKQYGYSLPALSAAPASPDERVAFALAIAQISEARCAPLEGLMVVLAPASVENGKTFDRDVAQILETCAVPTVRFIIVEPERASLSESTLGPSFIQTEARLDAARVRAEMARRIDSSIAAPLHAPGPAQVGAAWPRGVLPPGSTPPTLPPERIAEMGPLAGLFGNEVREIRPLALQAALALGGGDAISAIRFQTGAVERAVTAGLGREALVLELVLATYILHAGQREMAEERYRSIADRAKKGSFLDIAAQAMIAAGAIRVIADDRNGASLAYTDAAGHARKGGVNDLAIEGYRMAGQLRAEVGDRDLACRLLTDAVALADTMPLDKAGRTSAPLAARQLATLVRGMGEDDRAAALEATANRMTRAA